MGGGDEVIKIIQCSIIKCILFTTSVRFHRKVVMASIAFQLRRKLLLISFLLPVALSSRWDQKQLLVSRGCAEQWLCSV